MTARANGASMSLSDCAGYTYTVLTLLEIRTNPTYIAQPRFSSGRVTAAHVVYCLLALNPLFSAQHHQYIDPRASAVFLITLWPLSPSNGIKSVHPVFFVLERYNQIRGSKDFEAEETKTQPCLGCDTLLAYVVGAEVVRRKGGEGSHFRCRPFFDVISPY